MRRVIVTIACAALLCGCAKKSELASAEVMKGAKGVGKLTVTSDAFANGQPIPKEFTADGRNVSPPLKWTAGPMGTRGYVVIVEDTDVKHAPPYVHWIAVDLPATVTSLPAGVSLPDKAVSAAFNGEGKSGTLGQAMNSKGFTGYFGPEPPPGQLHHYHFELFAIDRALNLPPTADKAAVVAAMQGHVLAEGTLVGTYQR